MMRVLSDNSSTVACLITSRRRMPLPLSSADRAAAEAGDAAIQYELAECLRVGRLGNPDVAEATRWYGMAADQGLSYAQFRLGLIYYHGQGQDSDKEAAADWFAQATA